MSRATEPVDDSANEVIRKSVDVDSEGKKYNQRAKIVNEDPIEVTIENALASPANVSVENLMSSLSNINETLIRMEFLLKSMGE